MKQVFLLRHGTADMGFSGSDKDRPLLPQGKKEITTLADQMVDRGYIPTCGFYSSARRTRETSALVTVNFYGLDMACTDSLYNGSVGDLYEVLKSADDAHDSLLLIAHNPGIHGLAMFLAGQGKPEMIQKIAVSYQPGTFTVIQCSCERWSDLQPGLNEIGDVLIP